jgi:inner membrane protein
VGALCAALPDADVVGFRFGIRYGDLLGHRGLTHSFAFAAVLATLAALALRRGSDLGLGRLWTFLFLATASHALLDAMADGGLGVAFFSPFSNARYFFPFRPIVVSPINVHRFFTERGAAVMGSELLWVWLPSLALAAAAITWSSRRETPADEGRDVGEDEGEREAAGAGEVARLPHRVELVLVLPQALEVVEVLAMAEDQRTQAAP